MGVREDETARLEEHRAREEDRRLRGVEDRERWSDRTINETPLLGRRGRVRLAWAGGVVAVLILLGTLPPLVNVNRYQRRVAAAIAGSIGRPVHFDSISMHLLPLPGFTIQNFVVLEDPAFGAEPAMRANVVEARVRVSSLWRRRVEISRIRLEAPSVNLVRRPDGAWNMQGVVAQAGQLRSAPTAQQGASEAPRFPYIEATAARLNLKLGEDKLPYSLVDAKFALWLPTAQEWHLRLQGRPLRTDTDVSDVGELRIESTLGRGGNGGAANEPLTLDASWKPTPMGETGKLVTGVDGGWRGEASAELSLHGTASAMAVVSDVHVHDLRRAEFVPRAPMNVDAHCEAEAMGVLHQLHQVRCVMPTAQNTSLLDAVKFFRAQREKAAAAADVLTLEAELPNALDWRSATVRAGLERGSPEWILGWMRLLSTRIEPDLKVGGDLSAHMEYGPKNPGDGWSADVRCRCVLPPVAEMRTASQMGSTISASTTAPGVSTQSNQGTDKESAQGTDPVRADGGVWALRLSHVPLAIGAPNVMSASASRVSATDTGAVTASGTASGMPGGSLPEQSVDPVLISGRVSRQGYTVQYASAAVARYATGLVPTLGDQMPGDLTDAAQSERSWGAKQAWTIKAPAPTRAAPRGVRHQHRPTAR